MKVLGIVGGIGSGKSFVADCFARLGATVIDADTIGHQVLDDGRVREALVQTFGADILRHDGSVDRRALARRVFAPGDEGVRSLRQLEMLTHPEIERRIETRLQELRSQNVPVVVLDAAIMLQTGWHRVCDELIFVEADDSTRYARVACRGWSRDEWQARERRQSPLDWAKAQCKWVVFNGGEPATSVEDQVGSIWERMGLGRGALGASES